MEETQKEQFSLFRFLHAHEQSYQTALEEVREEKKEESLDLTAPTYAYRLRGGRLFAHGLLNIFRTHFQRKE